MSRPARSWLGGRATGILISVAALIALARLVPAAGWTDMVRPLASADMRWLAVAVLLALLVEIVKAVRWQLLVGIERSALPRLMAALLSSRVLNATVPLRAGDVWRVAYISAGEAKPLPVVAGSVIAEKLLDGTVLAFGAFLILGSTGLRVAGSGQLVAAGITVLAILLLALGTGSRIAARFGLARWLASAEHLRKPAVRIGAALLTIAAMGLGALVNLAVLSALGMAADWSAAAVMLLSAYAVGLIPAAPAQMGTFELGVSGALMAAGTAPSPAVTVAIALHAVLLATLALGGLLSLALGALRGSQYPHHSPSLQGSESLHES